MVIAILINNAIYSSELEYTLLIVYSAISSVIGLLCIVQIVYTYGEDKVAILY